MTPSTLLVLALVGLLVGPVCASLGTQLRAARALVDGFGLALVLTLAVVFVLPHAIEHLGLAAVGLAAVGVALPLLFHRSKSGGTWSLAFVALALGAHVVLDGAVLAIRGEHGHLGWAVVAHRLPVGFALVVAAEAEQKPLRVAWALVLAMVAATFAGFALGPSIEAWMPEDSSAAFDALVVGVLLHVVLPHEHEDCEHEHHDHQGHDHEHHEHEHHEHHDGHEHEHEHEHEHHEHEHHGRGNAPDEIRRWSAVGSLLGLVVMFVGWWVADEGALDGEVHTFMRTLGVLLMESAPALLIGYALAGIVPFLLTPARTSALASGGRFAQSLRGVVFGLPLPVCSCGVLPLYESLIRRGAPAAAALAFFVATPELGLDAVLLSVPLLGKSLTIARVVAAFLVALLTALIVGRRSPSRPVVDDEVLDSAHSGTWPERLRAGLRFGFVDVFDHTMPWVVFGLVIAATVEPLLEHGAIDQVPSFLQVPAAVLVGIPVYVCASGATPVAAIALHKGLSAGAAIAFLIAGPATNVTTFGVMARLHGRRTAVSFGVCVSLLAMIAGWSVDAIGIAAAPVFDVHTDAETHASWISWLSLAGLAVLSASSLFRQGPRSALRQIIEPIHTH